MGFAFEVMSFPIYLKLRFNKIDLAAAVAIAIILTLVAVFAWKAARVKAADAKRVRDVQYIQQALQLYFNDHFEYPGVSGAGAQALPDTAACEQGEAQFACYLPDYPNYPKPRGGAPCENYSGYAYGKLPISEGGYRITFCLDSAMEGLAEGLHQATANGIR